MIRNIAIGRDGENDRGGTTFRRQRPDLAPHLETLADHRGEVVEDLAEIAAVEPWIATAVTNNGRSPPDAE